jgi:SEC-C motif-containing protein
MPKIHQNLCACGSGHPRVACCGLYLDGLAEPPRAEALMRARYSANVEGQAEFLAETYAPESRNAFDHDGVRRFSQRARWLGLKILETTDGGPDDETGTVTFEARYHIEGHDDGFRERSRFRRVDGRWRYVDGDLSELTKAKIGRNDPCLCGSGEKFKRCCGR